MEKNISKRNVIKENYHSNLPLNWYKDKFHWLENMLDFLVIISNLAIF